MVWSAYLGLPLSLAGVGAVLQLDKQKLEEGKDLIKYFCQPCLPTKTNGGRTRNLPHHAPEKWETFKSYNLRDVETEMSIQEKLARFPVPDHVWDEYHLDQEINDRGIRLDMQFVENAIMFDGLSTAELNNRMRSLTALKNPNSVTQMKEWLAEHPGVNERGVFTLFGGDGSYLGYMDKRKTERAYLIARQARFEHGEKPTIRRYRR